MAKVVFKSYNQNDNLLFPPCLGDFIAENDPVRVLNAIVDHLDISRIESSYEGGGASSYNLRMMLKVVFYAYLQNVYSGRMKEDAMRNGQTKPGYNIQISTENQFITHFSTSWRPTDWGTFINHMDTFEKRYGKRSKEVVADSGYGNEQNYEYLESKGIEGFVKYTMFHAEQKRKHAHDPFLPEHLFYNADEDYYVCPMGQHMTHIRDDNRITELGYRYKVSIYRARNCTGCPLRGLCYKGKANRRTIEANHRNNELKARARERLMSKAGLEYRSKRPVEPEAVFGQIKYDGNFKRFHYRGNRLVIAEFATLAIAHNIKKLAALSASGS